MLARCAGVALAVWGWITPGHDCITVCATGPPVAKNKRRNKMEYALTKGLSSLTSCLGHEAAYHLPHSLDRLIKCQILVLFRRGL